MFILIGIWLVLIPIYKFILFPLELDVPRFFPISVLYPTGFNASSVPFLFIFIIILFLTLWRLEKINLYILFAICFLLIFTGNLIGGGYEKAILIPFNDQSQYYYDALTVPGWKDWLASFNANQTNLSIHGRTHPPFAILIHHLLLFPFKFNVNFLAGGLSLLSVSTFPMIYLILRLFKGSERKQKLLLLLFAVIPAVNIYSVVSLDGVILATSTMFLLGLVVLIKKPGYSLIGILLMIVGFSLTNLLTFSGLFLAAVGGLLGLIELVHNKKPIVLIGTGLAILFFGLIIYVLLTGFQYDHIQAFRLAAKIENPGGFRLFSDPINYLLTRFENISEIAFFVSFPLLAILLKKMLNKDAHNMMSLDESKFLFVIGSFVLMLTFLTGAYRTGETARACLYFYPYILLMYSDLNESLLSKLVVLAAVQTIVMQMVANYYW